MARPKHETFEIARCDNDNDVQYIWEVDITDYGYNPNPYEGGFEIDETRLVTVIVGEDIYKKSDCSDEMWLNFEICSEAFLPSDKETMSEIGDISNMRGDVCTDPWFDM